VTELDGRNSSPLIDIDTSRVIDDQRAVELLRGLVNIRSQSGCEREAVEYLSGQMAALGMHAAIDEAGNAVGWIGSAPGAKTRDIVLLGHIDTVAGDIPVRIADGVLHGRGAVDAKGPLAAFVCSAAGLSLPPNTRVVVIGAVGEEADSRGAHFAAGQYRPAACIIGEPSGVDGVTLGYKGNLRVRCTFECEPSHSAGPGTTATELACAWWERVRVLAVNFNQDTKGVFASLQARLRSMHTYDDGLSDRAVCEIGFRLPAGLLPVALEAQLCEIAASGSPAPRLDFYGQDSAWVSTRNDPAVRAVSAAIRAEGLRPVPKLKTGTADMNVVGPVWRCPIVAYGPGDSALDHTPHEHIVLDEYLRSIRVLRRAILDLAQAPEQRPDGDE